MPGSESKSPSRIPVGSVESGAWLQSAEPHSPQNALANPSSGCHSLMRSCPAAIRTAPGSTRTFADAAVPVRRWQRVQWQYCDAMKRDSSTSKRTPPHMQPPVSMAPQRSGHLRDMVYIVIGALLILTAPLAYMWRNRRGSKEAAGAAHTAVTRFGGGEPRSERRLAVNAFIAPVIGVALIVFGVAHL